MEAALFVTNELAVVNDGRANAQRTGQWGDPFVNLEDALLRADEVGAAYEDAKVTVYLTKGEHFAVWQPETAKYRRATAKGDMARDYSLTIK